ncbi:hypothetical protein [Chromobacterium violaceum]|uniref:hypothetical protein n=1 Tax=Chromobacterium violaceum TaxID=536 RepID=UPI0009DA733F|nr:hypothetical protein [Chromobacterium violaceum]QND82688.1 Uncharacterized protein ChrSW_0459 [Chromobacterium vaccinii]OQS45412.1 hypothetical protein B0T48_19490 [Chromobacterium violaceum]OQS47090.1 hypothetical protein B0T49_18575 [Chromobacterium violaceum]QND87918.1 Uncharacterized protein ChrSV_0459 [Chromobacterium vaccinii]QRO32062.1 hypothetical protein I6K04_16405 [Chromobacterium violaceum]
MATLTHSGRAALAAALASQTLHFAWGIGQAAWDDKPVPEPIDATALVSEVGRRLITEVRFVAEDPAGEIVVPTGRYRVSNDPTRHLLLRIAFEFGDAPASVIREVAVFAGSKTQPDLPAGQRYFTPDQIAAPGILVALERITPIHRSPATRETFEHVISL